MSIWNPENVATLKRLWADGESASSIAGQIRGANRNAVIGKIHRLGLSGRVKGYQRSANGSTAQPRTKRTSAPRGVALVARDGETRRDERKRLPSGNLPPLPYDEKADLAAELEIPVEQRKTFQELGPTHCNWPVGHPGTPGFFFCGGERDKDAAPPYCTFHTRLSFAGPSERRGQGMPFRMLRRNP